MTSLWQAPVVVASFVTWFASPASGLADIAAREALRRELTVKAVHTLTTADLPVQVPEAARPEGSAAVAPDVAVHDDDETEPDGAAGRASASQGTDHDDAKAAAFAGSDQGEAWWRDRLATARAAADDSRVLADALQTRLNSLASDIASRDDPYQRAVLQEQYGKAARELETLQKQILVEERAVDQITDEGRKAGVPAGWLRERP
jgi:hypothetical protein